MRARVLFLICFLFTSASLSAKNSIDMVVFSYDRPMQLYALFESLEALTSGLGAVRVLYRASSADFSRAYDIVKTRFEKLCDKVQWFVQGAQPKQDFKPLLAHILDSSNAQYTVFATDDIIIKDYINFLECCRALEQTNAYGFYLRLGKNINYCYSCKYDDPPPPLRNVCDSIFMWRFSDSIGDWAYPNSVDMTVYRTPYVKRIVQGLDYCAPNSFESLWAQIKINGFGLCFEQSKVVNIPANLVQNECTQNPYMHNAHMSPEVLLSKFMAGYKIDISKLFRCTNRSPHSEYTFTFMKRY